MNLLELTPATTTVVVGPHTVTISKLSSEMIGGLCRKYSSLVPVFTGGEYSPVEAFASGAFAAGIAAACGYPEWHEKAQEAENKARGTFGIDEQITLIKEILRLTFPGGVGPFVELLGSLVAVLNGDAAQTSLPTSPNPSTSSSVPGMASAT